MKILKLIAYGIIAYACSLIFFNGSLLEMIFIFVGLNCLGSMSKEEHFVQKRIPKRVYEAFVAIGLIGVIFIITEKFYIHNSWAGIIGALLVATSITALLIGGINFMIKQRLEK